MRTKDGTEERCMQNLIPVLIILAIGLIVYYVFKILFWLLPFVVLAAAVYFGLRYWGQKSG
jgi:hypothetical protein